LGIRATPASAKGDQFPALVKPLRHVVAGQSNSVGLIDQSKTHYTTFLQCVSRYSRECSHWLIGARIVHGAISSRAWEPGGLSKDTRACLQTLFWAVYFMV